MAFATNGDVRLYYETFGSASGEPMLLLTGAGSQCIDFDEAFCESVAAEGFRVIRFDPRDTGLSSALSHLPSRLSAVYEAVRAGRPPPLAYGLDDLVDDAFAVLDAAGSGPAHLFGRSLGSAVAQRMALRHPERVRSMILAIAFSRGLADTLSPAALGAIESETFADAAAYVARRLRSARSIGSPALFDAAWVERQALRAFARGVPEGGAARHFAVGVATPDLRPALGHLAIPTLIIHGALDRVVPPAYAVETAAAIKGARLEILEDMGHDGPPMLLQRWAALMIDHLRSPQRRVATAP